MKKFFKTVVQVTILSEDEPCVTTDLTAIECGITSDGWSGQVEIVKTTELTAPEVAKALMEQGSDPEFFGVDENGKAIETVQFDEPQADCPYCLSANIVNEDAPNDGFLEVHCSDCGSTWTEPAGQLLEEYYPKKLQINPLDKS